MGRHRSVPKRRTVWQGFFGNDAVAVVSNAVGHQVLITEAKLEMFPQGTLVRIRGVFDVFTNPVGANNDDVRWGAGIYFANSGALAAGTGSLQFPLSQIESGEWMWWATGLIRQRSTYSEFSSSQNAVRVEIDSKAMRKFSNDQALVIVVQTSNGAGTTGVFFDVGGRALIMS